MFRHHERGRSRLQRPAGFVALLAVLAALVVPVIVTLGGPASADTSGTPDTNTKAAIAPISPNVSSGGRIDGALEGTTLNVHVDGVAGKMFGVTAARLCKPGLTVTQSAQLSPTQFGNCIPAPFVSGTDDDFKSASASPSNTSVDFTFRVGAGSQTFSYAGGSSTITCGVGNPCALWLWEQVDTTINPTGNIFKHFDITYKTSVTASGCKASTTPGGQISTYPAWGASQSAMRVACIFDSRNNGQDLADKYSIHDWDTAVWHNGAARTVTMTTTNGSPNVTVTPCDGIDAASALPWINHPVSRVGSDTGMPVRSFLKSITTGTCAAVMSGNATVTGSFTAKIDNAPARSFGDASTTAASTTMTSASANFTQQDVGMSVSGSRIAANTTIASVTNATTVALSIAATSTGVNNVTTIGGTIESTTTRQAVDSTATSTGTNKITMSAAKFKTGFANSNPNCASSCGDTGLKVTGTGLTNCVIASVAGAVATMTTACVNSANFIAGNKTIVIGDPSITAPSDGEGVLDQGTQLDLQPLLVAGSNSCTLDEAEGFHIVGNWRNPGSITGVTQPDGTKAIGEIFFETSATNYGGLVIERNAATAGDPQINPHYDIVFPSVPTALALCNSATSPGVGFSIGIAGSTPDVAKVRQGNGKPGSSQLRAIREDGGAGWSGSAYVRSDDPSVTDWTGSEFERLCIIPAGNPTVDFKCGTG